MIELLRTKFNQKYNKQMANSTVSRSNGGIKMLPAGSLRTLILTGVYSDACFLSDVSLVLCTSGPHLFMSILPSQYLLYMRQSQPLNCL